MNEMLKELFPPDVPPVLRWRLAIFAFSVLVVFHIVWACGWLEFLGISGFAKASDLEQRVTKVTQEVAGVKQGVNEIKIQLLEQSIFDAKERECTAGDVAARRFFASRVLSLSREYYALAGSTINIPPCRN